MPRRMRKSDPDLKPHQKWLCALQREAAGSEQRPKLLRCQTRIAGDGSHGDRVDGVMAWYHQAPVGPRAGSAGIATGAPPRSPAARAVPRPPSWRSSPRTAAPARSTVSKEKGSGEEQSISSPDASMLSENEVEKMVKEAEANAVADKEKHEKADLRIKAETSI
jgi:hypothetical protein